MTQARQVKGETGSAEKPHHHLPTGPGETWGGQELKRAIGACAAWLARNAEAINSLNVFPVPDGDTGTNMALTMHAAVKQVAESPSHSAAEIAAGLSHGALMGARGNSGVILSQIWRGFAEGIAGKERISAVDFADGLVAATATAYRAVLKPVEGTILTVIKDTGQAAQAAAGHVNSYAYVLDETSKAAKASVARTPTLLDKLRDAGVVDAGGQGLYMLIDGIRRYAEGEDLEAESADLLVVVAPEMNGSGSVQVEHGEYGYCTNFILVGGGWDFDEVRARIAAFGDSAVIVGDERVVKVHIHTETPGTVLDYATSLGKLRQIAITDMQEQHEDFLAGHGLPNASTMHGDAADAVENPDAAKSRIALVVVASGQGLVNTFKSMGATAIVEGGQTMNPSTEDLLKVIEKVPQDEVIILPNNGNIVMSARQTVSLTKKKVAVVPTDTIPQGMGALLAFNYEADLDANVRAMDAASKQVETGEITRAVRDAKVEGIEVKVGEIIGLLNNKLVTTGPDREEVAWDLLEKMGAHERELITIYWGGEVGQPDAEEFQSRVQDHFSNAEVELVHGGQPFYDYIISAE
ncbi:MAG: DAK2 domain-containing protein [Chloroflexota bacterium]|nr:DAK2 domain-containing protein [Chloroflexota bacterium]MDQ5867055.1 DAK2 domain-containing protein [Chloroflexota bacterium]